MEPFGLFDLLKTLLPTAQNAENPPDEIKDVCTFVPVSHFDDTSGFFVIFQSAATGECIKPERA